MIAQLAGIIMKLFAYRMINQSMYAIMHGVKSPRNLKRPHPVQQW